MHVWLSLLLLDDKFRCKLDLGLLVDMTETISSPLKVMGVLLTPYLTDRQLSRHMVYRFSMN